MRYGLRILSALVTFSIGLGAFFISVRLASVLFDQGMDNLIPAGDVPGKVTFRFVECAGRRAVFVLDNGTDHRIFARVQPADFWEEFKKADLEFGVHIIEYRAPGAKYFIDVGPNFHSSNLFQTIMPNETIRYGVNLQNGPGEYRVKVPFMDDAEVARRLDEVFPSILKDEFPRVVASWKRVSSEVVTNRCY